MEKQKENIQSVKEEELEQAVGGSAVNPDRKEENPPEAPSPICGAQPRFI